MNAASHPTPVSSNDYPVEESVEHLMSQIVANLAGITTRYMAEHGLTNAQWKPLLMLQQRRCGTAAELARMSSLDTGAVTRMLDRLEAKGLVQRSRSREDRRVVKVELTADGEKVMQVVPDEVQDAALTGLADAEVHQFRALLKHLLANVQQLRNCGRVGARHRNERSELRRPGPGE